VTHAVVSLSVFAINRRTCLGYADEPAEPASCEVRDAEDAEAHQEPRTKKDRKISHKRDENIYLYICQYSLLLLFLASTSSSIIVYTHLDTHKSRIQEGGSYVL